MTVNVSNVGLSTSNVLQSQTNPVAESIPRSDEQTKISTSSNKVNLSDIGKSISKLDALNSEFEQFIESKVPANVIDAINKTEEEFGGLLERGVSENSDQSKELSRKLDQQYSNAQSYLSQEEQDYLSRLESEIEQLEISIEGKLSNDENTFDRSTELAFGSENQDKREMLLSLLDDNSSSKKGSRTLAQNLQNMIAKISP